MTTTFLLLGSNTGNSKEILKNAYAAIEKKIGHIANQSAFYVTEPWGLKDQPAFYNQALLVQTELSAEKLLEEISAIEQLLGRIRIEKWGPRTIDIDIIYYGSEIVVKDYLKIPHPEMQHRQFVLIPIAEIAPDFIHPIFNITTKELLNRCEDISEVKKES